MIAAACAIHITVLGILYMQVQSRIEETKRTKKGSQNEAAPEEEGETGEGGGEGEGEVVEEEAQEQPEQPEEAAAT